MISIIDKQLWYSNTSQKMDIIIIMLNVISSHRNVALKQLRDQQLCVYIEAEGTSGDISH